MPLPIVEGEFRVGADPGLRYAASGTAVCSLRAVASSRKKQDDGTWVDDKSIWVQIVCFKQMAENVAESVQKGDLIVVRGRVSVDEWETDQGEKRTTVNILADHIGPSLSFATAKVTRTQRSEGDSRGSQPGGDPWATPELPSQPGEAPF